MTSWMLTRLAVMFHPRMPSIHPEGLAANSSLSWMVTLSASDAASVTIQDSELFAANPSGWIDGIRGWNITANRVNIHDVIDSLHLYGNNTTLESSWLHSNLHYASDPAQNGGASHDDSIQIQIGTNI